LYPAYSARVKLAHYLVEEIPPITETKHRLTDTIRVVIYIILALVIFLFAIDLMISSLQWLGRDTIETLIRATSNPFNGLFIGLLVTALIQSSSTTTALTVAMVASGSLTLHSAVPIIMGANVGTTITSSIISLGFINRKKDFKRAVAAGSYHCFFNLLTGILLFPLEYHYRFLSDLSQRVAAYFATPGNVTTPGATWHFSSLFEPLVKGLMSSLPYVYVWMIAGFVLLFGSILLFRKLISDLLKAKSPEAFSRFFFRSPLKSFAWGLITTAAIRSSTITTSVVVPIVAKKITTLRQAAPFIMGANIGTTITAFIAAVLNSNASNAISIAMAHFMFNLVGVILFFPIPALREIPIRLSSSLGRFTSEYRFAGVAFILITFFFLPFALLYLSQG
jgi:solute carrier family 34 (sodium-dependent phosphate cotransporter)